MPRKKKQKQTAIIAVDQKLIDEYIDNVESNPQYSLVVDPEEKYNMSDSAKRFVEAYLDFNNIPAAAQLAGLQIEDAKDIYNSYAFKQEVNRLRQAKLQRRFANKMLTVDQIGGFLTSLITEENLNEVERIGSMDKVRVAQILLQLNELKSQAIVNPNIIDATSIEENIKELSIDSIKQLLANTKTTAEDEAKKRTELIEKNTSAGELSPEELAYLNSLPIEQLLDILEQMNDGKKPL